jgi:DNA-directed RNA polymerase sigma subunit (sigma70/sigma32)
MIRPPREPAPPSRRQRAAAATVRAAVLLTLTPEEREVVCLRYGLNGDAREEPDLQAIADQLHIPFQTALRRFRSASSKLREVRPLQRARAALLGQD